MIYDAGDYYLFSPDDAMLNSACATYGYIPFVGGWMKDQIAKAYGFTFITDKKIEKAKSNLSLTVDITSQVEKIGNLKSIGKTLGKSLKFLGKAADIIGKAITTLDVVNEAFVNKEWELNQLVDKLFGDELISTTKEGLIEKYVVAIGIMKQYVKKGIVDYTSNGVDMITDYSYKEDYINSAKKVINNVDKKNNAWR